MLAQARFESDPLEDIAGRVSQPALVHWGDHDRIVSPGGLPVLERAFSNMSSALFENCGHLPMFEMPKKSDQLFTDFLAEKGLSETD